MNIQGFADNFSHKNVCFYGLTTHIDRLANSYHTERLPVSLLQLSNTVNYDINLRIIVLT
jgi:hypothetical protein